MDQGSIVLDGTPQDIFSRIEAMKDLGLQVPQVTLLMRRLREKGWDLNTNILTIDEACMEISSRIGPVKEILSDSDSPAVDEHG
jgi:hypothetical protein